MECEKSYMEIKEKGEKTSFIDQLFHKTELRAFYLLQFLTTNGIMEKSWYSQHANMSTLMTFPQTK